MEMTALINWLLKIFLIVLGVILIYQLARKVLGGSWHDGLLLGLILANLGYSFYIGNKISEQKGWLAQYPGSMANTNEQ